MPIKFMLGILFIEMRTKDFTKVFGHGISSNVIPNDTNWNDTSGFRTTVDGVKKYLTFRTNIWIGGTSMTMLTTLNLPTILNLTSMSFCPHLFMQGL